MVKVKVGFLYSATYTKPEQRALQSRKWQLIGKRQRCCSANAAIHCARYRTIGPPVAASKHTTAPINHTRPSPRKHSPDGTTSTEIADTRWLLTTHLSTAKGWKAELA